MVEGYNIAFKLSPGEITIAGRVQDDLTVAARIQERLTKDDQGVAQVIVLGHDVTFRASGLIVVNGYGLDRDWAISAAQSNLRIQFLYLCPDGGELSGYCRVTNYTESSNASDDATWTMDFRTDGELSYAWPEEPEEEEPVD